LVARQACSANSTPTLPYGNEVVITEYAEITEGIAQSGLYYPILSVLCALRGYLFLRSLRQLVATDNSELAILLSFRFSTKYLDTETGFHYYGCRYYDPNRVAGWRVIRLRFYKWKWKIVHSGK